MKSRTQAPNMTSTPPKEQPFLTPNRSRIMLQGVATKGCIIGANRIVRVIKVGEY